MAEILQIIQLGDPVLRSPAQLVNDIQDERIQKLIDELQQLKGREWRWYAPQVAESSRLFIASRPNSRYPHAPAMDPLPCSIPEFLLTN